MDELELTFDGIRDAVDDDDDDYFLQDAFEDDEDEDIELDDIPQAEVDEIRNLRHRNRHHRQSQQRPSAKRATRLTPLMDRGIAALAEGYIAHLCDALTDTHVRPHRDQFLLRAGSLRAVQVMLRMGDLAAEPPKPFGQVSFRADNQTGRLRPDSVLFSPCFQDLNRAVEIATQCLAQGRTATPDERLSIESTLRKLPHADETELLALAVSIHGRRWKLIQERYFPERTPAWVEINWKERVRNPTPDASAALFEGAIAYLEELAASPSFERVTVKQLQSLIESHLKKEFTRLVPDKDAMALFARRVARNLTKKPAFAAVFQPYKEVLIRGCRRAPPPPSPPAPARVPLLRERRAPAPEPVPVPLRGGHWEQSMNPRSRRDRNRHVRGLETDMVRI
ncbi:hypothetical protein J8273_3253 [Carpediemonas membranifera]|uniref:Uncharacterized protein n=1 Tax=Carpediemonas membranifera TaxID=201153 RepID=A0A8J6B2X0_9EUKA|nr:hypothetical protein J8273_3253 [Carpediemonas membranifera]|eukprot:KAG9393124.1 hypothetical protein J8273_3253 [Carpediemonas membranifera]